MKLSTPDLLSLGRGQQKGQRMGTRIISFSGYKCLVVPSEKWHELFSQFTLSFEILCFRMLCVKIQKTAERLTHQGTLNTKPEQLKESLNFCKGPLEKGSACIGTASWTLSLDFHIWPLLETRYKKKSGLKRFDPVTYSYVLFIQLSKPTNFITVHSSLSISLRT